MKIPVAAIFSTVKAAVVKHAPGVIEAAVDKAGKEILRRLKKKIRGR